MKGTAQGMAAVLGAAFAAWGLAARPAAGAEWTGKTEAFRVDGRAGSGAALEVREREWATWDAAWTEGSERVEVTLERPGGAVETLGAGEGNRARGSVEWTPGDDEWGMFTLRHLSWDADGVLLSQWTARRMRRRPEERAAYAAWVESRGGSPDALLAEDDADGDGASNWDEYVADTDPWNRAEVFESKLVAGEGGALRVEPSVVRTGRVYWVNVWRDLTGTAERRELGPGREGIGAPLGGPDDAIGFGAVGVSVP